MGPKKAGIGWWGPRSPVKDALLSVLLVDILNIIVRVQDVHCGYQLVCCSYLLAIVIIRPHLYYVPSVL